MIFWALPLIQDLGYIASGEEVRSKETVILSSVGDWNTSSTLGLGSNGLLLIRCNATSFSNPRNYLKVRRDQPTCQLKNKPVLLTKRRSCSRTGFSSQILGHLSTRSVFESFFPVYFFFAFVFASLLENAKHDLCAIKAVLNWYMAPQHLSVYPPNKY